MDITMDHQKLEAAWGIVFEPPYLSPYVANVAPPSP
jgi:hypothetical protein